MLTHPRTTRTLTVALSAAAAALVLSACGGSGSTMGSMGGMNHGSSSPSTASAAATATEGDIAFAQLMIPHHEQAVDMARLALTGSDSAEVKALAEKIMGAQGPEVTTMKGWLSTWGAPLAMPSASSDGSHDGMEMGGMSAHGMMTDKDMAMLKKSTGPAFDRAWLQMMIAHHEGAITMANQVLTTTKDPAVATLAKSIVTGQTAEIDQMKPMLTAAG